jgi:hypothetical protein
LQIIPKLHTLFLDDHYDHNYTASAAIADFNPLSSRYLYYHTRSIIVDPGGSCDGYSITRGTTFPIRNIRIAANVVISKRSLTSPISSSYEDAMTFTDHADVNTPMPDSPPDLTGSKSSKSSSFHSSYQSDDNGILSDVSHFEDIGLGDDAPSEREMGDFAMMTSSNLYTPTYATDLRNQTKQRTRVPMLPTQGRVQRELTAAKARPAYPSLRRQVRSVTSDGLGLMPMNSTAMSRRGFASPSTPFVAMMKRQRSPSPNISHQP